MTERMENALNHIKTSVDVDPWAVEEVERVFKAYEQTQWIPVTERLPKEFADVLVCTDAEEIFIATYLGKMNDGTDCFDDDDGMMWEGDVIAWQSLPKPYKGVE